MANYPFFQKTLSDSTPFPGTMAETSTPTPMGVQPQAPQTPQPTEAPGSSGDRERAKKIQESIDLIDKQLQFISTMKYNPSNKWSEAIHLGLNGKVTEPVDYTYKKFAAMNDFLKSRAALVEEQRLLLTPNPATQKTGDEAADRQRRAADMNFIDKFNRDRGLPPVPQEIQIQYIEKGYSLNEAAAKAGGDDELKQMIGQANLGQEVGPEGVSALGLTGRAAEIAGAAARHGEKVRTAKAKSEPKALPVLGLFSKPAELFSAMHKDYRDQLNVDGYFHMEDYEAPTEIQGITKTMQRKAWSESNKRDARAAVAAKWPGYEKYFPNFVAKGFTDVPPIAPPQSDVDVNAIRQRLKQTKAPEKK